MKEYICKKNLLEHIHQRILSGNYQEPEDVYSDIDNFPTVTKADIRAEAIDDFVNFLLYGRDKLGVEILVFSTAARKEIISMAEQLKEQGI